MVTRFLGIALLALAVGVQAQTVRMKTNLGDIDVELLPDRAPQTVANFLRYLERGAYNNTMFHRSVANFIIQTGGYTLSNNSFVAIAQDPAVRNEFGVSNTRGTIAMAKLGNNPNSATNQFFFNLGDNSGNLDSQNGGFTVFGRVANDASLAVMDRIASQPVVAGLFLAPFDEIPLYNWRGGSVTASNIIVIQSMTVLRANPSISEGGLVVATAFGGGTRAASGSYVEIYGANLAGTSRGWQGSDFNGNAAPTTLDGVQVKVNNIAAYVNYVSPGQVNIQLPDGLPNGQEVPITVTYNGQTSGEAWISIAQYNGGLLAPAGFKVGDRQYVAAQKQNGDFISGGNIPGIGPAPAVRGETLTIYGTGFGPISPNVPALSGFIAAGQTQLVNSVAFKIGSADAQVSYAGLAPGLVGVYQFNIVVPAAAQAGDQTLSVTQNGQALAQTLYINVAQ